MGDISHFAGGDWEPKFQDFAVGTRAKLRREGPEASAALPWVEAPADSHVMRFRLQDATRAKFDGFKNSFLTVWFKATKTRPASAYNYYFSDHAKARSIFDEMSGHAHPGEVVHARLIKGGIPYEKTTMADEDLSGVVHLQPEEVIDLAGYEDDGRR